MCENTAQAQSDYISLMGVAKRISIVDAVNCFDGEAKLKPLFAVFGVGLVLLLVAANWPWPKSKPEALPPSASKSSSGFDQWPVELQKAEPDVARAERLAEQAHGDFSRLLPDDRKFLNTVSHGHGRQYIEASHRRTVTAKNVRTAKEVTSHAKLR